MLLQSDLMDPKIVIGELDASHSISDWFIPIGEPTGGDLNGMTTSRRMV
jgi:hypothetical protein